MPTNPVNSPTSTPTTMVMPTVTLTPVPTIIHQPTPTGIRINTPTPTATGGKLPYGYFDGKVVSLMSGGFMLQTKDTGTQMVIVGDTIIRDATGKKKYQRASL